MQALLIAALLLANAFVWSDNLNSGVLDNLGANTVFKSYQLANSPVNGLCLTTDGTNNSWSSCSTGPGDITGGASLGNGVNIFDSESAGILRFNELEAGTNITFSTTSDSNTIVISSSGSGSGFSTTSANFWESTFGNWNLVGSYLTPTTTGKGIIVASSTIGDGVNGLTVVGRSTSTDVLYVGPVATLYGTNGPMSFGNIRSQLNATNLLSVAAFGSAVTAGINSFSAGGTAAAPSATLVDTPIYFMGGRGFGSTVWNAGSKAAISFNANQQFTDTANGTRMTFETTANDTTTRVERMRITDRGSISIGTSTPYATTTIWGAGIGRAFEIVLGGLGLNASTTLFFAGPGGATTTGFAATTLANCDTIDTDASGNFKCGSDNASAGSGSGTVATSSVEVAEQVAFFTTNGASPALISGDTGFTFNAAGDRLTVTNASTTRLSINNWAVSTTTTVCEVGCQFNSIQAALDFLPAGGGTIIVKNGSYSVSQLLIKQNNTKLIAESQGVVVTCSSSPCVDYNSTGLVHTRVQGFKFVNGGASYTGIGIDTSGALIANIEDNWFDGFATSSSAVDGALNSTFYNEYKNNRMTTTNTCYSFTGAANNNNVIGGRCAPHQANGTEAFGVYIDGATHNVNLFGVNVEPNGGSGASTTAVYVGGASHDILISGGHYENMLYGVDISADSFNVKIESPYFYSTHTDAWGVCARAGSTGNFIDTSFITMTAGSKFCSEAVGIMAYSPSNRTWLGIGTTTAKGTNANLSLSGSYSTALDPLMWIQNNGAFAAAYSGIGFGNETGGFTNGLGKIGFEPGSGYTDAKFMIHVADSAKALQERLRINVRGWLGLGTSTPYARLTVWGDSTDATFFEVANTASTTIFKAGPGGATTTGFAATSLLNCDTIDTDANGNFKCGTDTSGGAGTGSNWAFVSAQDAIRPTTTVGIIVNGASSTINNVRINFATTTNASTTNLSLVNPLAVPSGGTGQSTFPTGHILYGQGGNALSSEAAFDYDDGINRLNINGSLNLGDVGVILSQSLGTLTFTGLSGTAEDLTVDLATADNISFTSSTGVATATWSGINLVTPLASTTATSTFHGLTFTGKSCAGLANSGKLTLNSLGQVICLDDTSGGGGGSGTIEFEIANNVYSQSSLRPTTTQNLVINGAGTSTFAGGLEIGRQIAFPYLHSTSTATSTFAGDINLGTRAIWGHSIFGDASDGLFIKANNGTQVANFGAGNSANATFYGGVNIDGQTRIATSISGVLKAASGVVSAAIAGVDYLTPSFRDWQITGGSLTPTTTIGITVQASSTIAGLTMARSTTTNATTTSLFASELAVAGVANFGATATSSFSSAGVLNLAGMSSPLLFSTTTNPDPTLIRLNGDKMFSASTTGAVASLFVGWQSGNSITTGTNNTGIGHRALGSLTSQSANTAVGSFSMNACTGCDGNTAVGYNSLLSLANGAFNTAFGWDTLRNTTGSYNAGFGTDALLDNTSGSNNATLGTQAGRSVVTGSSNTFVGTNAGYENETSMYAGDGAIITPTNVSKSIAIGYNAQVRASSTAVIGGTGADYVNLAIGTTTATASTTIWGNNPNGIIFNVVNRASSTILSVGNNGATTTNLHVSGETKLATSLSGVIKAVSGIVSQAIDGVDFLSPNFRDWSISGGSLAPTSTRGILVQAASSTINGLTINVSTTTSATTTNLSISGGLTFNGITADTWAEFCTTITGSAGLCDGNDASGGGSFTGAPHALVASVDGSTLSSTSTPNFVAFNATSTTATSTILGDLAIGSSTPDIRCFFCVGTTSPIFQINSNGQVGFGAVNTGPTKFAFGNGTNINVNPNIMFLVQDTSDARMGVSVGDDFIGMKSAGGRVGIFGFDYAAGTALDIVMQEFGGKVGIGTTTPWATLSVMPTTFSYLTPLFSIATSTNASSTVLHVTATSTTLTPSEIALSNGAWYNGGSNVTIGTPAFNDFYNNQDTLNVNGNVNEEWMSTFCDNPSALPAISADGLYTACPGFYYGEDGAGGITTQTGTGGIPYSQIVDTTALGGAGVFSTAVSPGSFLIGTSTPIMEVNYKIVAPQSASTTKHFIGFTNQSPAGAAFEADTTITDGCYFTASSTQANWIAIARNSLANITMVDTGVASSTRGIGSSLSDFRRFRIVADNDSCEFFIRSATSTMRKVATITTNLPTGPGDLVNAGIHYGRINGGVSTGFAFYRLRVWWRDVLGGH